jgi:flagellar L-ring protein precursor FlgH
MRQRICASLVMAALLTMSYVGHAESLYDERSFRSPVADRKARRPGDSLTVLVFESASATTIADTTTDKTGGISLSVKAPSVEQSAVASLSDDFSGGGRIQRSGKVLAQLTVTVESVELNGELNVKGDQLIEVNGEKQSIKLEGRVRPADISDINTVASNRLANARISYIGEGILGEKQRAGLMTRILTWLGLL